jgi:hypothetical protein
MRFVRTILLVLLALNLPGWAFAAMPMCSMPHAAADAAQPHAALAGAAAAHASPCCADNQSGDGQAAGTACQDGAHCHCGALYQAMQPVEAAVVPPAPGIDQNPLFHVITTSALPLWRPPTPA